jgi:hypothetical protein
MPLARIITEHLEESLELAIQLRSRGFEVETVAPNQFPDTPADLEVRLDSYDADEVLAHIMSLSAEDDSYVFVAPGTLDETVVPPRGNLAKDDWQMPLSYPLRKIVEPAHFELTPLDSPISAQQNADLDVGRVVFEEVQTPALRIKEDVEPNADVVTLVAAGLAQEEPARAAPQQAEPAQEEPAQAEAAQGEPAIEQQAVPAYAEQATRLVTTIGRDESQLTVAPQAAPRLIMVSKPRRADAMFWRIAILAAALAVSVVVVGSVWQQKHPAAGTLSQPGAQQIPFQKAPEKKTPVTLQPSAPPVAHAGTEVHAPVQTQTSPPAKAPPVTVSAPSQPKSPPLPPAVSAKKTPAKTAAHAQHHAASHASDSGRIAQDTVVYFNRRPAAPTYPASSTKQ